MLFSSVTFLYYFLPAVLIAYFVLPHRAKNGVLLVSSLMFYAWGEPRFVALLVFSILSSYVHGLLIERFDGKRGAKLALASSIIISVGLLGVFKYADFFISSFNSAFGLSVPLLRIALPIGISFYTFQLISYTVDVYRGDAKAQHNFFTLATYAALFPQLIAGPIVRYSEVELELEKREHTLEGFASGAFRFTLGLAKKVLIANQLASLVELYKSGAHDTALFAWMYAIAFPLQLYFDFSGYSDMAIGLGRIFGFKFPENFNYPYISASVSEFWRRWHMTLGSWFRDYVYIPMGGNRVTKLRWAFNLLVVWVLTGLWHGAGWNFAAWGLCFAVLLSVEKLFLGSVLDKLPRFVSRIYTLFAVLLSFIIFDQTTLAGAFGTIGKLFGAGGAAFSDGGTLYYLKSYLVLLIMGIVGATPAISYAAKRLGSTRAGGALRVAVTVVLLALVTAYLVDGSYNPFIYFRF